jgi:hypothetical protein
VEIVKNDLNKYYEENLIPKTSFFRRIPVDQIMKWSNKLLEEPLSKMKEEYYGTAVQMYKSIIRA